MGKSGREKNTHNKAKHAKLMQQKKNKLTQEKAARTAKLKAIMEAAKKGNDNP